MSMKPGRDDHAGGIDGLFGGRGIEMADGRDVSVADRDIGCVPGRAVPSMIWPLRIMRS